MTGTTKTLNTLWFEVEFVQRVKHSCFLGEKKDQNQQGDILGVRVLSWALTAFRKSGMEISGVCEMVWTLSSLRNVRRTHRISN